MINNVLTQSSTFYELLTECYQ